MKKKIIVSLCLTCMIVISGCTKTASQYYDSAEKLLSSGSYKEAIEAYQQAIKIDGKNIDAYIGLANAYQENNQTDEAIQTLQSAISVDSVTYPDLYVALANAYLVSGDTKSYLSTLTSGSTAVTDVEAYKASIAKNAKSVIWNVVPSFEYKDIKEITSKFTNGYYGPDNFRQDIVAVTNDGLHYGIADYDGNLLVEEKYKTFDNFYTSNVLAASTYLFGTDKERTETWDVIDSNFNITSVAWPNGIGGTYGEEFFYRADGVLVTSLGYEMHGTNGYLKPSSTGVSCYRTYEDHSKAVIFQNGVLSATVQHDLICAPRESAFNNGFANYANVKCTYVPQAYVPEAISYGTGLYNESTCKYWNKPAYSSNNDSGPKFGYYDVNGKDITEAIYDDVYFFTDGYAAVARDGKYGYIDTTGKEVVPMVFDKVMPSYKGKAWACVNGKWGVLDLTDTISLGIQFTADTISASSGSN